MKTGKLELQRDFLALGGFYLKALIRDYCDGDEAVMWERYFNGDFDDDLRNSVEAAVNPTSRATAIVMRGFLKALESRQSIPGKQP